MSRKRTFECLKQQEEKENEELGYNFPLYEENYTPLAKRVFGDYEWKIEGCYMKDVKINFGQYKGRMLREVCEQDTSWAEYLIHRHGGIDPITKELATHFTYANLDWENRDWTVTQPGPFQNKKISQIIKMPNGFNYIYYLFITYQYLSDKERRVLFYHLHAKGMDNLQFTNPQIDSDFHDICSMLFDKHNSEEQDQQDETQPEDVEME